MQEDQRQLVRKISARGANNAPYPAHAVATHKMPGTGSSAVLPDAAEVTICKAES